MRRTRGWLFGLVLLPLAGCADFRIVRQSCVPSFDLELIATNNGGAPQPGASVDVNFSSLGTSAHRIADGAGHAVFTGLPSVTGFQVHVHVNGLSHDAWRAMSCSPTPRHGMEATHIYTLSRANDILPTGARDTWRFGIFDTGAEKALINDRAAPAPSDTQVFQLCDPTAPCDLSHIQYLPTNLDVGLFGLQAVSISGEGAPMPFPDVSAPEHVVPGIHVGTILDHPTLLGGPITSHAVAEIDYGTTVYRNDLARAIGVSGPAMRFWSSATAPTAPFMFPLEALASTTTDPTGPTDGSRYLMRTAVFGNGGRTASGQSLKFLYDTGNTTTQVTESVATALGIDLSTPIDTFTIHRVDGDQTARGYMIEYFDLITGDGANRYRISRPMIYVLPSLRGPAANIGSNYFYKLKVLFNGAAASFGLFAADPIPNGSSSGR